MTQFWLAYFDPGSGSIILQLVISSILGAGVFFRHSLYRVLNMFRRREATGAGTGSASDEG